MTSRNRLWIACGTLLGATTFNGCADTEVAAPASGAAVADITPVVDADHPNASNSADEATTIVAANEPAAAAAPEDAIASVAAAPANEYEPPFPDRVDLFVAPKRQGAASGGQDSTDRAVELMGFIRVDRSRAILSINGETNALAEGESSGGIEVISVQPPSVVLRRGRQRWQATIE